jgi:hypothetical protein
MEWNHSNVIALSKTGCVHCNGLGLHNGKIAGTEAPCNCVLRSVFRACYSRFRNCISSQGHAGTVQWEHCGTGRDSRRSYGRRSEDFMADFCLVAQRTLDKEEYDLFRFHYLLGADWKLCARRLGLEEREKGSFFHLVYRVEQKLGRAFATLAPYALYPPAEYFGSVVHRDRGEPTPIKPDKHVLRPPMASDITEVAA